MTLNNRARRPTHPGEVLSAEILPATGLTQTELAQRLGVAPRVVSELLRQRRAVTPVPAPRLARVFQTTPELWLNLQQAVDVWESYQARRTTYEQIAPFGERQAA